MAGLVASDQQGPLATSLSTAAEGQAERRDRLAYGKLKEHLKATHFVETFTYDWRASTQQLGDLLAKRLDQVLMIIPDQPVRILAHSMGGLVVRAAFATDDGKAI